MPWGLEDLETELRARSAVLIAGPTASGKSAFALSLARQVKAVLINANSMQVYRDLAILTARPSPAEIAAVPHVLYGHVEGACNYSVGRWLADVVPLIKAARELGALPIVVGGTGLYFKALVTGISDIPPVPQTIRDQIRAQATGLAPRDLHARLQQCDPASAAGLRPSDPQRILRALEVFEATGIPLSVFQKGARKPLIDDWLGIFLAPERKSLNARIDARFEAMVAAGALEEVRALAARAYDPALPVMRAHGVPGLLAYLHGSMSWVEAIERGKADTRHYAKRQFTWARHQLPGFRWVGPEALAAWHARPSGM